MNIPILMYHEIYKPEERLSLEGLTNPAYNLQFHAFERQIAWLGENKIKTLTIDDLVSGKGINGGQVVCLTFDDGWQGNYLHAYPLLLKHGLRATFFVAAGLIGRGNYMTWEQLSQMQSSGMSIQSHTVTHRPLAGLGERELIFELLESKKIIEERLSCKVRHLSLPHGVKEARIWALAEKAGYRSICTSDEGFYVPSSPTPWMKRIRIGDGISEDRFHSIILGRKRAILGRMVSGMIKEGLKKTVGWDLYRKLYLRKYARSRGEGVGCKV